MHFVKHELVLKEWYANCVLAVGHKWYERGEKYFLLCSELCAFLMGSPSAFSGNC